MARGEMCSETYKINKQELNDTIILTRDGKVQTGTKLFGSLKSFTPDLINYLCYVLSADFSELGRRTVNTLDKLHTTLQITQQPLLPLMLTLMLKQSHCLNFDERMRQSFPYGHEMRTNCRSSNKGKLLSNFSLMLENDINMKYQLAVHLCLVFLAV